MNNDFEKAIKRKPRASNEWRKGLISKESYVLEVRKCTEKVRIAKCQAELDL